MKKKYFVYDFKGNWLGCVYSRNKEKALQEACEEFGYNRVNVFLS